MDQAVLPKQLKISSVNFYCCHILHWHLCLYCSINLVRAGNNWNKGILKTKQKLERTWQEYLTLRWAGDIWQFSKLLHKNSLMTVSLLDRTGQSLASVFTFPRGWSLGMQVGQSRFPAGGKWLLPHTQHLSTWLKATTLVPEGGTFSDLMDPLGSPLLSWLYSSPPHGRLQDTPI